MSGEVVRGLARTLWADWRIRRARHSDDDRFERLYAATTDPWALSVSPMAQQRYLAVIDALTPLTPCNSILDVGCGEGHLTRYLTGLSHRVVGIDVSPSAVARAQYSVPSAHFIVSGVDAYQAPKPFDIVTAVEMLYYLPEPARALERLLALGRTVIVSYSNKHRAVVADLVEQHPHVTAVQFCPFFGTKRFGFTIARLRGTESSGC